MISNYSKISLRTILLSCTFEDMYAPIMVLKLNSRGIDFFDTKISAIQKAEIDEALSESGEDSPAPRADPIDEGIVSQLTISHFVSFNTKKFFDVIQIETDFLEQDPGRRDSNEHYISSRKRVQQLKVVSDAAERGVSLIQNFNSVITNQEEQKQHLLQVVESHRQRFPMSKK